MVFSLSSKLKSAKGIESSANVSGILRWELGASPAVVSCFNPTFKSGTLHAAHLISRIWIHQRSTCSVMISAELHTTTGSACWRMKSFDRKKRSPGLNAVTRAQLACRSSVRVKFRDGSVGQSDLSIQSQSHIEPHSRERSSAHRCRDIDI